MLTDVCKTMFELRQTLGYNKNKRSTRWDIMETRGDKFIVGNQTTISDEITIMGFSGELHNDLTELISDLETLQEFYNFIILSGENLTKYMIVYSFKYMLKERPLFKNFEEFEKSYASAVSLEDKIEVVGCLLIDADLTQLNKVVEIIDRKSLISIKLYVKITKWRKIYTNDEIITLLS